MLTMLILIYKITNSLNLKVDFKIITSNKKQIYT